MHVGGPAARTRIPALFRTPMRFGCMRCPAAVVFVSACLAGFLLPDARANELLPPETPVEAAIDHYIDARLAAEGVSPASQADDANLLRRTMLDLVGRPPTVGEVKAYLASAEGEKRTHLVDRLMQSPAFVRQQAAEFDALLMNGTRQSLREYLAKAFAENRSWDRMFREMLTGEPGDVKQEGSIRFVAARANDQDKLTSDTSVLFFGVNVSCAKCHDHPLVPDWKQDHYYGMLSFFSRTFDVGEFLGERDYGRVSFKTVEGESKDAQLMFLTGTLVGEPPSPEPDEKFKKEEKKRLEELKKNKEPPPPPGYSRRAALVRAALADDESEYFARAIVNHVWNRFLGRGLVEPLDQMHERNEPSHPELLAWLARDMKRSGYDLRRLVRGIVLSRAYARTSRWDSSAERPAAELFAVAELRPLAPWQYGTLLTLAARNHEQFPAGMPAEELDQRMESLEQAGRGLGNAFELPGSDFQVGVDEALLLTNGEKIAADLLRDGQDGLVGQLNALSDNRAADAAVWTVLSREPTQEELTALTDYLAQRADRPAEARRQLVWALLASSECRFNY
jgi:hypothetical protein